MSFTRDCVTQDITFECDACGEKYPCHTRNLKAANAEAKEQGWRARLTGNAWGHYCPDCSEDVS